MKLPRITAGFLYTLGAGAVVVLLGASTAGQIRSTMAETSLQEPFFTGCLKVGLQRSQANVPDAEQSCVGSWKGVPVVVSWYPGSDRFPTLPAILISMQAAALEGFSWGVELGGPRPRFVGTGDEAAARRMLPDSLLRKAEGMPGAALFAFSGLARESTFRGVVEYSWPEGWKGLVVRAAVPQSYPWDQLAQTLDRLHALAQAIVQHESSL